MTRTAPPAGGYQVLGRTVGLPVEVRRAAQWGVQYLVPAAAAQRIVDPTGLEVTGPLPGRALAGPGRVPLRRHRPRRLPRGGRQLRGAPPRRRPGGRSRRAPPGVRLGRHRRLHPPPAGRPGVHLRRRPGHLGLPEVDHHHRHRRARTRRWPRHRHHRPPGRRRRPRAHPDHGVGRADPAAVPGPAELLVPRRRAAADAVDDRRRRGHRSARRGDPGTRATTRWPTSSAPSDCPGGPCSPRTPPGCGPASAPPRW